ncbi:heavy-metal-associated domain-containing protein [Ruania alba]|uniref:Copper chaperone CopZ n=1 Tax=Ruania alba TaxID=648782 RepID=A0A1H5HMQ5_9MICO|nr:heavy metal-associated domain-containing protein [Ruania alba]SEE29296.1 Copper chaperone CopZ [Ruania alba]
MTTATYEVKGMTCTHCVGSVTAEVETVEGIRVLNVDVDAGRLEVESSAEVDDAAVLAAVEEAGYEASRL